MFYSGTYHVANTGLTRHGHQAIRSTKAFVAHEMVLMQRGDSRSTNFGRQFLEGIAVTEVVYAQGHWQ